MTIEEQVRERLTRATTDVRGEPDLESAVVAGRRRRVLRGAGVAAGSLAAATVVTAAVVGVGVVHPSGSTGPAVGSVTGATSAPDDRVPGTTVDETLRLVVSDHVARPGELTAVHPSDWTRTTPLAATAADRATEWQARYRVGPDETLTVVMSQRPADAPAGPAACAGRRGPGVVRPSDIAPGGSVVVTPDASASSACEATRVADGTLVLTREDGRLTAALYRSSDDTLVVATSALAPGAGESRRVVTAAELEAVATDARLSFPHATNPPAWPAGNGAGWPSGT